jgi:hypothetical protein
MGPTSENVGYDGFLHDPVDHEAMLQWVRRPRTSVMRATVVQLRRIAALQWVRRPRTSVMPRCPFWLFRNDLRGPLREVASLLHLRAEI